MVVIFNRVRAGLSAQNFEKDAQFFGLIKEKMPWDEDIKATIDVNFTDGLPELISYADDEIEAYLGTQSNGEEQIQAYREMLKQAGLLPDKKTPGAGADSGGTPEEVVGPEEVVDPEGAELFREPWD